MEIKRRHIVVGIYFDEVNKVFYLNTKETSYIMKVLDTGYITNLHYGKRIRNVNVKNLYQMKLRAFSPNPIPGDIQFSLDTLRQEYPQYGNSDMRIPAYQVQLEEGNTISDLKYLKHRIYKGKEKLEGLPATYVENENEATTLDIELYDDVIDLKVILTYTVFEDYNAITRSVKFVNEGIKDIKLLRALSMNVDFKDDDFDMLQLSGAWARERHIVRRPLTSGLQAIESRRGASSHQQNPFLCLMRKNADEYNGEVYGFSLVYSGNFAAYVEVDQFSTARVSMGINPFDFTWLLKSNESFQTPEVVMVYSDQGLNKMSETYHKLYRERLCRGKFRDMVRPVLINNWEATYFKFNEEKLLDIAKEAAKLGIELFVLDDGWFGKRNCDDSSLGDWYVDKVKLPDGLEGLAKKVNETGLKFGLWFEPEMVSPDSDLYRKHPDWCLHVPNRSRSLGRNQLILDLSRDDVCEFIIKSVSDILNSANISYVKWDMNRHMTEISSELLPPERQKETAHRYVLGLYKVLEKITSSFPDVLFEGCSGGGGRFDPGMLYYMPQIWASDDTDAIERIKVQYGTSIVYPISTICSHLSAVPNHQIGRITPIKTRGNVAMSAEFGYELDLSKLNDEDKEEIKNQVKTYKEIRNIISFGDFYRLESPFDGNEAAWMFVTEDKREFIVFYFKVLVVPNAPDKYLRLRGINDDFNYMLIDNGEIYGGDELQNAGLYIPDMPGDFQSVMLRFKAVE